MNTKYCTDCQRVMLGAHTKSRCPTCRRKARFLLAAATCPEGQRVCHRCAGTRPEDDFLTATGSLLSNCVRCREVNNRTHVRARRPVDLLHLMPAINPAPLRWAA